MRRLSGMDAVFLAAEGPENYLGHTMAVLVLDPSTMPAGDRVGAIREYVGDRLHLVPPLQRCLVEVPLGLDAPRWIDGVRVHLDRHIQEVQLPEPVGVRQLASFVSDLAERKLDRRYPLWRIYVVDGLVGGRLCIVAKMHHALMDGGAGMAFMASLFDLDPEAAVAPAPAPQVRDRRPGDLGMVAGSMTSVFRRSLIGVRATGRTLGAATRVARRLVDHRSRHGAPLAVPFSSPHLMFNAPVTTRREVAFTSLSLETIKGVARAFEVTVNDVVLGVVAGAMRRFLLPLGALPDKPLIAAVPVSVRGDRGVEQSNMFSVMLASLATDQDRPADRLLAIHRGTLEAKRLQSAVGSEVLSDWLEVPVPAVFSLATSLYARLRLSSLHPPLCNLLVSDVPGAAVPLYFARARLESIFPLGPIFDGMGLNITAVSSADTLDVGLVACPDQLPDLWALAGELEPALTELDAVRSGRDRGKDPSGGRRAVRSGAAGAR